jgi:predicted ATPase
MEGSRLIHRLKLTNFLSYGSEGVEIELQPLNVLIGANASGKSNLIEALGVLRAMPTDLAAYFRERGGVSEYIHQHEHAEHRVATVDAWVDYGDRSAEATIRHHLSFAQRAQRLEVIGERTRFASGVYEENDPLYEFAGDNLAIRVSGAPNNASPWMNLELHDLKLDQSILSQRRDSLFYPELTHVAASFERIAIFQDWTFGRRNRARIAQGTDKPADFLLPDASNLGLVLHELMQNSRTRGKLLEYLKLFYDTAEYLPTRIFAGAIQLFVDEGDNGLISATRLSDGTLRYLSLLAVLCHPAPPPLICIEEPEIGLHPDVVPTVARLLKEASERTQLVVTTHSDALVSALSDEPDSVIVCEQGFDGTSLRRLDRASLESWLENYSLGDIWRMGEIGGNRW